MNIFIDDQKKILQNYVTDPDVSLKESDLKILPRTFNVNRLLNVTNCVASTTLKPKRDYFTGEIIDFVEVPVSYIDANAKNSMSLKRAPAPEDPIRGNPMNFPFWPGGFDEPIEIEAIFGENFDLIDEPRLTTPPGFAEGYKFLDENTKDTNPENTVNLLTALEKDLELTEWLHSNVEDNNTEENQNKKSILDATNNEDSLLETIQPVPILSISQCADNVAFSNKWVEIIDTSKIVTDFETKIPNPALSFGFTLDNFQKQGIIKLEEHKPVCLFISAHTSAGKTVIAEYAIALSKKHKSKTFYTSPIKALSNQKYKDFKKKFKDVGLMTGDLQIEPTASCLIMTTEILRSLLFSGSDVIREVEYVIFDEVHYINDPDRGHVWEEVLVLLPDGISIIMLSATVPNVVDLAEWVGVIKKRKVYVISTLTRPIPLEHYLFVDSGGKKKQNMHLIVDSKNRFLLENYNLVKTDLDSKKIKSSSFNNPKEEERKWNNLIDYLKKTDKLPIIAFTLSRNRCDSNAIALKSKNLNNAKEKGLVYVLFKKCLSKLKPEDRVLKQVLLMQESLERGIGIHHSGILPILKEIVEIAFEQGCVKVLFATETFAMGVNVPARSVVFDSFKKFDGTELRCLKPSEYTQMAGRAGRRGHDDIGTVILFCKQQLPSQIELQNMILGRADLLLSKFRLRYAVILKCFIVDGLNLENIIKQSFKEFRFKKEEPANLKRLKEMQENLSKMKDLDKSLKPLETFFNISYEYLSIRKNFMRKILVHPNYLKEIKAGKVIIVTFGNHYNKLGIILTIKFLVKPKETTLKILVLDNQKIEKPDANDSELWHNMISLTKEMQIFRPIGAGGHTILEIQFENIVEITKTNIKIEPDSIIKNWEQRQIERFRDSPPSQSVQKAVTELNQLNENYISKTNSIQIISFKKESGLSFDQVEDMTDLWKEFNKKKEDLQTVLPYTNIANFQSEFKVVFERKMLEQNLEELKFKTSPKCLSLYTDYCDKLCVLKELGYVDENEIVHMKGKLACNMGQNELLITELIFSNTFAELEPAEIAALLSGLVFQAKTNVEVKLPNERIKNAKEEFEKIYNVIELTERKYNLPSGLEMRLNFGLIEVVYEWAKNTPFSKITEMTDIQEGIIVRCIQQLDETIQDVKTAAATYSNPVLKKKMEDASTAIKRDIVFTPSLYTC